MLDHYFFEGLKLEIFISILILITLVFSSRLRKRYSTTGRIYLWTVYACFLCLPLNFVFQIFSTLHSKGVIGTGLKAVASQVDTESTAVFPVNEVVPFETMVKDTGLSLWERIFPSLPEWIFYVWLMGALMYVFALFFRYAYFRRDVKVWSKETIFTIDLPEKMPLLPIRVYPKISSPMLIGYFRPMILVPDISYPPDEQWVVIIHETMHCIRGDLWKKLFFQIVQVIHWYNPAVHIMINCFDEDLELCCDRDIVKQKDRQFRNQYSQVLLQTISRSLIQGNLLFARWGGSKKAVGRRLENIYKDNYHSGMWISVVTSLFLILLCVYI